VVAVESFECLPGRGVAATLSGVKVRLTSIIFFNHQNHLELSDVTDLALDKIQVYYWKHHWHLMYTVGGNTLVV